MGTRATIHIAKREEGVSFSEIPEKKIVSIYHHYDGYPEGHGLDLSAFLNNFRVVNGLGVNIPKKTANGMGCLAASLVAELKDGPGNVYIEDRGTHGWIDYYYVIWGDTDKEIWISIFDEGECIFVGKPEKLLEKYDGKLHDFTN